MRLMLVTHVCANEDGFGEESENRTPWSLF